MLRVRLRDQWCELNSTRSRECTAAAVQIAPWQVKLVNGRKIGFVGAALRQSPWVLLTNVRSGAVESELASTSSPGPVAALLRSAASQTFRFCSCASQDVFVNANSTASLMISVALNKLQTAHPDCK